MYPAAAGGGSVEKSHFFHRSTTVVAGCPIGRLKKARPHPWTVPECRMRREVPPAPANECLLLVLVREANADLAALAPAVERPRRSVEGFSLDGLIECVGDERLGGPLVRA